MRLAHFGTFDVRNYGDCLFPLIGQHNLADMYDEIVPVSPAGGQPYTDVPASVSFESLLDSGTRFDAVLVGGGNIIHARPSNLPDYGAVAKTSYISLWAGAAALAAARDVPLLFNNPGVPRPMGRMTGPFLREAAAQANYFSVRDEFSAEMVRQTGVPSVTVVPDSALDISAIFGEDPWATATLPEHVAVLHGQDYLAVHLKKRYVDVPVPEMAALLDRIATSLATRICLVAIDPVHGSDHYAENVARAMSSGPVLFDDPRSVRAIAAVIANSKAYIGSSMHGFVTATSYGVPAILVATHKSQHKFNGLLDHLEGRSRMVPSWDAADRRLAAAGWSDPDLVQPADVAPARRRIAEHWEALRAAALRPAGAATSRFRDPRSLMQKVARANFVDEGLRMRVKKVLGR